MLTLEQILLIAVLVAFVLMLMTLTIARRAERRVPPLGRLIDLPLARLHVLDQGGVSAGHDTPTLILIHGLGGQLRHFTYGLVDRLTASYRVIAIDRPGSGYSSWRERVTPSLEIQADVVASLIDHLDLGRVVLVGHSLGGAVALCVALRHRHRVAALSLLSPLTRLPDDVPVAFRALSIGSDAFRVALAWTIAVPLGRWQRPRFLKLIFDPDPVPNDFGTRAGGELALRPAHFLAATRDLAAVPQSLAALTQHYDRLAGEQPLPISVLYGRQDGILPAGVHGEQFARELPHARLVQIDAGHMLPIVQPEACACLIRQCVTDAQRIDLGSRSPNLP